VGVPAGMFGSGVLICIVEPAAQPATITTNMTINEKLIIFLITWTSDFDLKSLLLNKPDLIYYPDLNRI
jgi:hypothetical protein